MLGRARRRRGRSSGRSLEIGEVGDRVHAESLQALQRRRPDTPQRLHGQRVQEVELAARAAPRRRPCPRGPRRAWRRAWPRPTPAWRGTCWWRHPPSSAAAARPTPGRGWSERSRRRAEQAQPAGDVEERLVERQRLDQRRDRREDRLTSALTEAYRAWSPGRNTASGHSRLAVTLGSAERTPYRRASYDAAAITPARPRAADDDRAGRRAPVVAGARR